MGSAAPVTSLGHRQCPLFCCLPELRVPGLLPAGSGYWAPVHRWGLLWSLPAEPAQQGCQGWMSHGTRGRTRGTVPCSGTPCGLRLPCAWCQTLTGWWCILGTLAPWGLFPAPLTRQMGSCLPDTEGKGTVREGGARTTWPWASESSWRGQEMSQRR